MIDQEIEEFLRAVSSIFKITSNGKEIQIFCPYCGDEYRKNNPKWGHLYIERESGLFYCHRCNERGNLYKLLTDLNFANTHKLEELKRHYKIKSMKNTFKTDIILNNITQNITFNLDEFSEQTFEYLKLRLNISFNELFIYGIYPKHDSAEFYTNNKIIVKRFINSKYRYKKVTDKYYWISFKKNISNFIIAEGPFDIIAIHKNIENYMYSNMLAICGKNYIKAIKKITKYYEPNRITIYVDNDIDVRKFQKFVNKSFPQINISIKTSFYGKDVAEIQL